jgi:hypothetical protein
MHFFQTNLLYMYMFVISEEHVCIVDSLNYLLTHKNVVNCKSQNIAQCYLTDITCTRYNIMWTHLSVSFVRWFSPGTPVSSTNKTDRHDMTEILLKVALNTIHLFPRFTKYINRTEISWIQGWCKHPRESAIFRIFSLKDIHICKQQHIHV